MSSGDYLRYCRALIHNFRGKDIIPASQKTTHLHLSHAHFSPEQILHRLMHLHSCSSQCSGCSTQPWRKYAGILLLGLVEIWLQNSIAENLPEHKLPTSNPFQPTCLIPLCFHPDLLQGCAVLKRKTFPLESELSVVQINNFGSCTPVRLHLEQGVSASPCTDPALHWAFLPAAPRHHPWALGRAQLTPPALWSLPTTRSLENEADDIFHHPTNSESSSLQFGRHEVWQKRLGPLWSVLHLQVELLLTLEVFVAQASWDFPLKQWIVLCWISINGTRI